MPRPGDKEFMLRCWGCVKRSEYARERKRREGGLRKGKVISLWQGAHEELESG